MGATHHGLSGDTKLVVVEALVLTDDYDVRLASVLTFEDAQPGSHQVGAQAGGPDHERSGSAGLIGGKVRGGHRGRRHDFRGYRGDAHAAQPRCAVVAGAPGIIGEKANGLPGSPKRGHRLHRPGYGDSAKMDDSVEVEQEGIETVGEHLSKSGTKRSPAILLSQPSRIRVRRASTKGSQI